MGLISRNKTQPYFLISTAIVFAWISLYFSNTCNATVILTSEQLQGVAKSLLEKELQPRNDLYIEVVLPQVGILASDYKTEIIRQRINIRGKKDELRSWYKAILELNARFKGLECARILRSRYNGGSYKDEERIESLYLLNNRVAHIYFPYVDITEVRNGLTINNEYLIKKYFTVKAVESHEYDNIPFVPLTYKSKLNFGFVDELSANIATAKIAKQTGQNYKSYKNKAEIRLECLKQVYNHIIEKQIKNSECVGQLIVLFEKELARL